MHPEYACGVRERVTQGEPEEPAFDAERPADAVCLCVSGFGGGHRALRRVLLDWFEFLGGRPGEVVYADGGSGLSTTRALARLVQDGLIDRLDLINPDSWENSFERCYIQEHRSGVMGRLPFLCFVKLDTLPFRRGHERWLAEDLGVLSRPGVFAVTNTHLVERERARERIEHAEGNVAEYLVSDFASLNFALMTRRSFLAAVEGEIGELARAGFRGKYPSHLCADERYRRALLEWAWQNHCRRHGLRTLARAESRDWTIFHVNKRDGKLLSLRRRFRAREGVEAYFDVPKALYRPPPRAWQRAGKWVENAARRIRRSGRRGSAAAAG